MSLKLREYQTEALASLKNDGGWAKFQRQAIVLPTGMGKTVIMASQSHESVTFESGHVGIFVHRDELVDQTVAKLHGVNPNLTIGVVKAERNEWDRDVVIMSVQTIGRLNRLEQIPADRFTDIIVDECHHSAAPSYRRALEYFGGWELIESPILGIRPKCRVTGYTATLGRADKRGLGDIFQRVAFKRDILYGIRKGFLVDIRGKAIEIGDLDLDDVKRVAGDYTDKGLGDALTRADAASVVARKYLELAHDRQGVVFCPTVAVAEAFTEEFCKVGIPSELVTGETPKDQRAKIFARVRSGETQCMINCMVLTEGFDMPQISCVVIARPTSNAMLYTQMVGRGARPWAFHSEDAVYSWMKKQKTDCLVLDLVGASRNRLASIADLSETPVRPEPDESLEEAADRVSRETPDETGIADFDRVTVKDVDLFAKSRQDWKQTRKGYWFIPTKDWLIAVLPHHDTPDTLYFVGRVYCGNQQRDPRTGRPMPDPKPVPLTKEVTLEYGIAWAESDADELDPTGMISGKGASWKKKKKEPATGPQVTYARQLQRTMRQMGYRMELPENPGKLELSDLISTMVGTIRLDRYTPRKKV